jgi:hypothetical protein
VSSAKCGVSQNRILVPYALAKVFLFAFFAFSALQPLSLRPSFIQFNPFLPSLSLSLSLTVTKEASNLC